MIFFPPIKEQIKIVNYLDEQISVIDKKFLEEKRIKLLTEYIKSLISRAVTGQFEVTKDML